ncbi:MAG: oxidoreductase [Candidatus Neomarinimicrobiota bacterium]
MNKKSVLLLGATGLVGSDCLKLLLADETFGEIAVLTRRPLTNAESNPRLREQIVDFDHPESFAGSIRSEIVVCALGTTMKKAGSKEQFRRVDFQIPFDVAQIAKANGAKQFLLVSLIGADPNTGTFYLRVKGELEKALIELGFPALSIFRPSLLLGKRAEYRLGESFAQFFGRQIPFFFPKKYKPITAEMVAHAIVSTAKQENSGMRIIESSEMQTLGKTDWKPDANRND